MVLADTEMHVVARFPPDWFIPIKYNQSFETLQVLIGWRFNQPIVCDIKLGATVKEAYGNTG
jgi:hypothetical protein